MKASAAPSHPAPIEADGAVAVPVAYSSLRTFVRAVEPSAPALVRQLAEKHPAEWNRLFPETRRGDGTDISDQALSPSERRLHRESEQTFRVLHFGARLIVDTLRACGQTLHVQNAGECDLVSLRGLMHALELARTEEDGWQPITFSGWGQRRLHTPTLFEARRQQYLGILRSRMRIQMDGGEGERTGPSVTHAPPAFDSEGRYLLSALDAGLSPAQRVASSILAARACFFSTNYEGALLAVEQGLAQLDRAGDVLSRAEVEAAWQQFDDQASSPAIEIDGDSLGDAQALRALLLRCAAVVHAFTGEHDRALQTFLTAATLPVAPEARAHARMFRGLMLIKRLGQLESARAEIHAGLSELGRATPGEGRNLHEGWLRNVLALTYFQEKKLEEAVAEEKRAIYCVGDLRSPSATHLKINLISNLSVVQESAKRFEESIRTWRRFEKISDNWGANFDKHHGYRLAGLFLCAGAKDEATARYEQAYESAASLGDVFHEQVISAELGALWLGEGDRERAEGWFTRATAHAREVGEPVRLAESMAGLLLAQGEETGAARFTDVQRLTEAATTHVQAAKALAGAVSAGAEAVVARLPQPRTKLNRPFDLVNLT